MKFLTRTLGLIAFTLASASSFAATYKYDLINSNSINGGIHYPGLDFSDATTAVLTVDKDPLSPAVIINSLEVTFPNAAKLHATGFKKLENENTYRAVVDDAWIYRQIIVDISHIDFNIPQAHPMIRAFVSERSEFIQPHSTSTNHPLFSMDGDLRDITPSTVIDTAAVTIDGKTVQLSLKENLSFTPSGASMNGAREGFVIDTLWFGKGQKTLYLPNPMIPFGEYDRYTAIGLILEELNGPAGTEYSLRVKFKDASGYEQTSPAQALRPWLDASYNSGP